MLNKDIEREAHARAAQQGLKGKAKCRSAGYDAMFEKQARRNSYPPGGNSTQGGNGGSSGGGANA